MEWLMAAMPLYVENAAWVTHSACGVSQAGRLTVEQQPTTTATAPEIDDQSASNGDRGRARQGAAVPSK
jgi:hypothetical protein